MGVDDAVQDKVESEVDLLQQVSDRQRRVEDLSMVHVTDGVLLEEVQQLSRDEEKDEEDDDDNEGEGDASGRLVAVMVVVVVDGSPFWNRVPNRRIGAQFLRTAQRDDEFGVGEDEHKERNGDAEREVGPRVDAFDARMVLQRPRIAVVHETTAGDRADDAARRVEQKPRNVEEHSAERHGHQRRDGERLADDLTGPQRVTDGDVATDGHRHRQPRTRQHERVDHAGPVQLVHQPEVETVVRESAAVPSGTVEDVRQRSETEK